MELEYIKSSQTHVCLMENLMSSNLTLFLIVHFHAVHGYAATHMHITHVHASIPFCHHHVIASCSPILICLSQTVLIDSVQTCTCTMIVYKTVTVWVPLSLTLKLWSCCGKVEHWVQLMCCPLTRLLLWILNGGWRLEIRSMEVKECRG